MRVDCWARFSWSGSCRQGVASFTSCPVCLRKWLHVLEEGDMGSSSQHHPLHLLYTVWPRVAGNVAGVCRGFFLEVPPQRSEPRVSLSQQLAEEPGSSGMVLG